MTASALIYRALVAGKTNKHALLGGAKSNTEKFGPLKVVLEKICALFADRTVRLQSPAQSSPLTRFPGIRCRREQGCNPPLTHSRIGGLFRFASEWCSGAETPKRFDTVRNCSFLTPSAHPPLASLMQSRKNCGRCVKSRSCLCPLITSKSVKMCSGFSKISERQSSVIRFVHDLEPDALLNTNGDSRWRNRWRLTVMDSGQ